MVGIADGSRGWLDRLDACHLHEWEDVSSSHLLGVAIRLVHDAVAGLVRRVIEGGSPRSAS